MDAVHDGRMLNANMHDYKVPTALEAVVAPEIVPIDLRDTTCNIAATKGLGEPATIPAAAAIANAVAHALGVRVADGPITPQRVLDALARASAGSPARKPQRTEARSGSFDSPPDNEARSGQGVRS